jgi:hypothetical protein
MTTSNTPIVAATSAMLTWQHRRGRPARCLIRLRTIRGPHDSPGLSTAAIVSELRDNPRGYEIGSDFAGLANTALPQLIPPMCPPEAVVWYAHHGPFSSYDPTGPETLTRVALAWDGERYLEPTDDDHRLLSPKQFRDYTALLHLEPVEDLLASRVWETSPVPAPRPHAG